MAQAGSHSHSQQPSSKEAPVCHAPQTEVSRTAPDRDQPEKIKVLIADDQQIAREVLRRLLRYEENVEIVGCCATGPEALEAIKQLNPDLVLLDVQMPGLNGFEVVDRLPENRKPLVIFVTANPAFEGRANSASADFLLKPCTRERIQNALRRALNRGKRTGNELNF